MILHLNKNYNYSCLITVIKFAKLHISILLKHIIKYTIYENN